MGVTFKLKVTNPVIPAGALGANVNWSGAPYESSPDAMPTAWMAVTFRNMPVPGFFRLYATSGRRPDGSWQSLPGLASAAFTPREGATYIWDMATNTVSQEGATQPGGQAGENALVTWAKANPLAAGAVGVAAYLFLFGKRRGGLL